MRYVRRWRQRSTAWPNQPDHLTAHRDLDAGRRSAGARGRDQVLTLGCVARSDRAHDREVRHGTARLAVEDDRAPLDGSRRCRVPDARRLLRAHRGQPEQPTCLRRLGRDDDRSSLRCGTPPCSQSVVPSIAPTRQPSRMASAGRRAASCAGIAPIPFAGSAAVPSASVRNITSNIRLEVVSDRSSWMPPNSGRKNRSMIDSEKPRSRSAADVVTSGPRRRSGGRLRQQGATELRDAHLVGQRPDWAPA